MTDDESAKDKSGEVDASGKDQRETFTETLAKVEVSVQDRVLINESALRTELARKIIKTFVGVNSAVLTLVVACAISDVVLLAHKFVSANERLITTQVIRTIIGATTVQLGAIAITLSNWLFPKPKI